MLLPLHPVRHFSGLEWVCVKASFPANTERSPGTDVGNSARCSWSRNQTTALGLARVPQSVTTSAKNQCSGEVKEGFKYKREEEQCSPRIPYSPKAKATLMGNAVTGSLFKGGSCSIPYKVSWSILQHVRDHLTLSPLCNSLSANSFWSLTM